MPTSLVSMSSTVQERASHALDVSTPRLNGEDGWSTHSGIPLVLATNWRKVMRGSSWGEPETHLLSGSSRSTTPSSTSCISNVVTNVLPTLPISKSISGVIGIVWLALRTE